MREPEQIVESIRVLRELQEKYGVDKGIIMFMTGMSSDEVDAVGGLWLLSIWSRSGRMVMVMFRGRNGIGAPRGVRVIGSGSLVRVVICFGSVVR